MLRSALGARRFAPWNMKLSSMRLIALVTAGFVGAIAVGVFGIITLLWIIRTIPDFRYAKFESDKMIGLSKDQVLARVGKPTSIIQGEDIWCYQYSMRPGAVLFFTDGKVVESSVWKKKGRE